jgi:hypothetical protein
MFVVFFTIAAVLLHMATNVGRQVLYAPKYGLLFPLPISSVSGPLHGFFTSILPTARPFWNPSL